MPVVSLADYRRLSGDRDSYDGDVEAALADAQNLLESRTSRFFDKGDYTEELVVSSSGWVYPSAYPIYFVAGQDASVIDGASVRAWGLSNTSGYNWDDQTVKVIVSYNGGYENETAPYELKQLIVDIANKIAVPQTTEAPRGATSVRSGNVAVTYGGAGAGREVLLDAGIMKRISAWRRPMFESTGPPQVVDFRWSG